jgi:hypothetical protein
MGPATTPDNCAGQYFSAVRLAGDVVAYHQVGLGFAVKRQDYLAIGVVLAMAVALMLSREGLSQAHSPYAISRWLQLAGLILLSLSAAASFVLSRVAMQMGGGKLAVALRFLTFYTLLRGVLVLIQGWGANVLVGRASRGTSLSPLFRGLLADSSLDRGPCRGLSRGVDPACGPQTRTTARRQGHAGFRLICKTND